MKISKIHIATPRYRKKSFEFRQNFKFLSLLFKYRLESQVSNKYIINTFPRTERERVGSGRSAKNAFRKCYVEIPGSTNNHLCMLLHRKDKQSQHKQKSGYRCRTTQTHNSKSDAHLYVCSCCSQWTGDREERYNAAAERTHIRQTITEQVLRTYKDKYRNESEKNNNKRQHQRERKKLLHLHLNARRQTMYFSERKNMPAHTQREGGNKRWNKCATH